RAEYGQRAGGQGTTVILQAGQTVDGLSVSLQRAVILTGRVCEPSGAPAVGLGVALLKPSFTARGLRMFQAAALTITDDRGEYRIVWASPGKYYLGVRPLNFTLKKLGLVNTADRSDPPMTIHPGVVDAARATIFDLSPAVEVRAADLTLTETRLFS